MPKKKPTYEELEKRVRELEKETERRKLDEEAIRESEDNYRVLFEKAPLGYQSLDDSGCFITVNQAWLDLLGYKRKEIIGKSFADFLSPQYQKRFKKNFPRFKKTGEIRGVEFELVKKDGSLIFASIDGKIGHDKQGNFKQTHCVLHDITERKLAEEALRESEEQLDSVLENIPDIIYRLDQEGNISFINNAIKDYGFTPEELIGRSIFEIVHPEDREKAIYRVNERRTGERKTKSFEIRLFLQEGAAADLDDEPRRLVREPVFLLDSEGLYQTGENQAASLSGTQGMARDITERKQMGQAISAIMESVVVGTGQDLYDQLVKNICEWSGTNCAIVGEFKDDNTVNVLSMYLDGEFKYGYTYDLEWSPCENAAQNGYCVIPEEVQKMFPKDLDLVRMGAESYAGTPLKDKDGKAIGILCTISRERLEDLPRMKEVMTILAARASAEIIRSRSDRALQESEARLKAIYENAAIGIVVTDNKGRYIQVNKHYVEMFGYDSEDEIIAQTVGQLTHPDDREKTRQAQQGLANGKIDFVRTDKRYLRKDGNYFWGDVTVTPLKLNEGKIKVFVAMIVDITERKLAEEALRESEEQYISLFNSIRDTLLVADTERKIINCNPAFSDLFGYTLNEIKGLRSLCLYESEKQFKELGEALKEHIDEPNFLFTVNYRKKSGQVFPGETSVFYLKDHNGDVKGFIGLIRDITERKELEAERAKASKLESIGLLAGGIAHDFNNILSIILGNVTFAKMTVNEERSPVAESLTAAEAACGRARDLTQQLLTFAKGGAPVKETIILSGLIKEASAFALRGSNVMCRHCIAKDLWLCEVDEGQISQVINNLIINADQAMPNGGTIYIRAENDTIDKVNRLPLNDGRYVKITIKDQGHGIPEDQISKIFDPYFTTKQKGSGLGLTTTYSIIKRHGGHIFVESELMVGTKFHIFIPALWESEEEKEEEQKEIAATRGKILVMDDEQALCDVVSKVLEQMGHEVECANNGIQALKMYQQSKDSGQPFDAVILDLTIPGGMGGQETIKRLLKMDPEVKAIVSSGYSNDPVLANFKEYGFNSKVSKPYRLDELREVIQHSLKEKNG